LGRVLIQTEAGDKGVSRVTSTLGRNDDQEGKQAQHCERGELQGAVHEVDAVEPGPEGSRRGVPHPTEYVGPLVEQPSLLIVEHLSPRSACLRGISRKRDSSVIVNHLLRQVVGLSVFAHGHDLLRCIPESASS